ncbi:MAG: glycosyl hydrolase family 25 [Ruminococcus sp.]|nr:glycosyl hydrolase family 25 [Ruminococcus sp.]
MSYKRKIILIIIGLIMTVVSVAVAFYFSTAVVNSSQYSIWGVDVSNYQGLVDWEKLENQGVRFAFIKATEGSGHVDESARRNIKNARKTDIKISAYHFFSFDSAGETQASNFISVVGADEINMPPVVDIEYYADKKSNKPSREEAEKILSPLLENLEEYYGVKPIIYTTVPVYLRYVRKNFGDYPLWIRCVNGEPDLINWKFWQYSDKGMLDGYNGEEKYIDLNIYNGSAEQFEIEFK